MNNYQTCNARQSHNFDNGICKDCGDKKTELGQIVLRFDDENGHHIIRTVPYSSDRKQSLPKWDYTIEGYTERPANYYWPPEYFLPISIDEVKNAFEKQGKEWRGQ